MPDLKVHATLTEWAGAEPLAGIDSRSMARLLCRPSDPHRDVVFSGLGQWRIAFDGRFKAAAGYDPAVPRKAMEFGDFDPASPYHWRLVDPIVDPDETVDLKAEKPEVASRLFDALRHNELG